MAHKAATHFRQPSLSFAATFTSFHDLHPARTTLSASNSFPYYKFMLSSGRLALASHGEITVTAQRRSPRITLPMFQHVATVYMVFFNGHDLN